VIKTRKSGVLAAILLSLILTWSGESGAFELTGAWAATADQCDRVFTRSGRANDIAFTRQAYRHGGGFIIEADRIRGKFITCRIKSKKVDGQVLNLIAGCASDIILSNIQFSLKVLDENTIARQFTGVEGLEFKYHRCSV
jgi:hypothetical protein